MINRKYYLPGILSALVLAGCIKVCEYLQKERADADLRTSYTYAQDCGLINSLENRCSRVDALINKQIPEEKTPYAPPRGILVFIK